MTDNTNEERFPNPPQRLVKEIFAAQQIIKDQQEYVHSLKRELDKHLRVGTITDKMIVDGVSCVRCERKGKYIYSELADQYALKLKQDLEDRLQKEREDGIAVQGDSTFYWTVREHKTHDA